MLAVRVIKVAKTVALPYKIRFAESAYVASLSLAVGIDTLSAIIPVSSFAAKAHTSCRIIAVAKCRHFFASASANKVSLLAYTTTILGWTH